MSTMGVTNTELDQREIENRNCNIRCRYGNHYMGVYCYADDLSLLFPTFTGLQEMLKICELYAITMT